MFDARSENVLASKLRLSSIDLPDLTTGGAGGTAPMTRSNTGEENNKSLDKSNCVFNTSSGIGDIMAGHHLPVDGSCRCPQELHRRLAFLLATGRLLSAGVCLVRLTIMLGTVQYFCM